MSEPGTPAVQVAPRPAVVLSALALTLMAAGADRGQAQLLETSATATIVCGTQLDTHLGFGRYFCLDPPVESFVVNGDGVATATSIVEESDLGGYVLATGTVAYQILVLRNAIPPINVLNIPLGIDYSLSAYVFGAGGLASAAILARVPGAAGYLLSDTQTAPGDSEFLRRETAYVSVLGSGILIDVTLLASATVSVGAGVAAEARATADPHVYFDQDAFDDEHGENSFPLEDFYSIEFSSGITNRRLPMVDDFETGTTEAWTTQVPQAPP